LIGSNFDDNLSDGNTVAWDLHTTTTHQAYAGLSGNDAIDGGFGFDFISGDDGNDTLVGGLQSDTLSGGKGNDRLTGGTTGNQWHWEWGEDVFLFEESAWGHDLITDFELRSDLIRFTGVDGPSGYSDLTITQSNAGAVIQYAGQSITLTGVNATSLSAQHFVFDLG
jgi:Ca2+-binding RTX toxin-like protein